MRYRSYSYEDYRRAMDMFGRGFGITSISRALKIPKSTLHYWKNGWHKPPTTRWTPEPSKELAYIIGVLYGDGCVVRVHNYKYYIRLEARDHDFLNAFNNIMAKLLGKTVNKIYLDKRDSLLRVEVGSKAFYTWYRGQTLDTLKKYIEYSRDTVAYFLRGLYDSEGYNYRCRKISLYNNDLKLLNYVQYLLKRYFNIVARGPYLKIRAGSIVKIKGEKFKANHNIYRIAIYRRQHVKRFLNEIGFSIREKQLGLPRRK